MLITSIHYQRIRITITATVNNYKLKGKSEFFTNFALDIEMSLTFPFCSTPRYDDVWLGAAVALA